MGILTILFFVLNILQNVSLTAVKKNSSIKDIGAYKMAAIL
jgi:hypothetical protein